MFGNKDISAGALACALALAAGCGTNDGFNTVTGRVTYDGQPISEGRIQFRMTEGDQNAYAGLIQNGEYAVQVAPGPALVEIRASRPVEGKFDESNPGEREQVGEMYIPAKYNSQTELRIDVQPGTNTENFDLTPA